METDDKVLIWNIGAIALIVIGIFGIIKIVS